MIRRRAITASFLAAGLFVAACGGSPTAAVPSAPPAAPVATVVSAAGAVTPTSAATEATPTTAAANQSTPTTGGSATPTSASTSGVATTTSANLSAAGASRYDVVASNSKADYRVREQLARLSFPSDAVGTTNKVSGQLVIGADGKVDASQSKLVADLTGLKSDSGMRDGFIQRAVLDTSQYPDATFVPNAIQGLDLPLPTSGKQTFKLLGDLTVHGVTKPVTFDVSTQVDGNNVSGTATTDFTFETFGMTPPKTGAVLSVTDDVKLEINLQLTKSA